MNKLSLFSAIAIIAVISSSGLCQPEGNQIMNKPAAKEKIIFGTFIQSDRQIEHVYYLVESIREFGGSVNNAPVVLYVAAYADMDIGDVRQKFKPLDVKVIPGDAPEEALWFYYAGKVYAAALAEKQIEESAEILVWLDDDTIFLREPSEFLLKPDIAFAYRPVMHNRSGTLYDKPPGPFWNRIYDDLKINRDDLYEMTTPADSQQINAYYNAGLLVVRPEKGILRKWVADFEVLYQDSVLADMCREDVDKRIFLHQTALVGAVLNTLDRNEMIELGDDYNYPLFFEQMYGAAREFGSIANITTLRYDIYFRDPDPEWDKKIKGPTEKVEWIKSRLGR